MSRISAPVQDSTSEPPRPRLFPPPVNSAPTSPPAMRYNTRRSLTIVGASSSRGQKSDIGPPKKKTKVSEPIVLIESSSEPESEPMPSPPPAEKSPSPAKKSPRLAKKSPPPTKKPQPSQAPARESQIPSDMTPEEAIRRPMVILTIGSSFTSEQEITIRPPWSKIASNKNRWNPKAYQGAPAGPEQPEEPVEIPVDTQPPTPIVAPSEPPPEVPSSVPQATPQPPPVIPPPSAPSPSAEPRVAIPIIEYRGLSHTYQALATS
uniref:Uncharacterized protein n=1 Tax=Vitis vinifera TaxID=29760 RepID=A5BXQ6_VITVI|nr:hypothetical protein VITISV_034397 [Vitis vinifera]